MLCRKVFVQMQKAKGLTMKKQEAEGIELVTSFGVVPFGKKVIFFLPEKKREQFIPKCKGETFDKMIRLEGKVTLIPFGELERDENKNFKFHYIASLGTESFIDFEGIEGVERACDVLNGICRGVFEDEGVEAKSLGIKEIKKYLEKGTKRIDILGSHWLSTTFFKKLPDGNRVSGIYSLEDGRLNKQVLYDENVPGNSIRVFKKIIAFITVKPDMEKTRRHWGTTAKR